MYLPNSYELFWNSSAEGFRERMLKEYKRFWNSERSEKAKALAQEFEVSHILEADIDEIIRNTDIIVDALPAGVSLLKNKELHKNIIVLDASYPKSVYEHSDIKCLIGGEKWLLHQAIPAFKLFTGLELDKTNYNQKALIDILIKS